MPEHPQAQLFRCRGCTHAFTLPESIRVPESYKASYYEQDHSRWFEHPNIELFERILAGINPGALVAAAAISSALRMQNARIFV
jgi:hypothetical protein